jgi:hypothetical protein
MNPDMSHYFDARGVRLTRGEDPIFPAPRCMTCNSVELMRPPVTPYLAVKLPLATNRRPTACDECTQPPRDQTKPKSIVGQTATSLPDWAMSALPSTPEAISAFPILRRRPPRFQEHHPNRPPARVLGRGSDVVVLFGCARSSRPWRLHALPRSGARASSPNNAHQARSTARRDLEFR